MIIFTVPQGHCVVIERLGKFSRVCNQGLHFKIPIFETIRRVPEWKGVANKQGYLIELTEQQTDTPPRACHTKDNVALEANSSVYWRIVDATRSLYEVDILPTSISDLALNALRSQIGKVDLDSVLRERASLSQKIVAELSEVAEKWGIKVTRVDIQEVQTSDETTAAMRQQMEAERKRRAIVSEADGFAEKELKIAAAERDASIMRAEGRAKALGLIAEAEEDYLARVGKKVGPVQAANLMIAQKYIEGFSEISKNGSNQIYLPNNFTGLMTLPVQSERGQMKNPNPQPKSSTEVKLP
jgi:regulator of protease activity HflC (stomatin/prohibitin superfamily)